MTNTVLIKRSSVANASPLAGGLQYGELAINYNDGTLYFKNTANAVVALASTQFVSVTGNVTGGNILTSGAVSASGAVTANSVSISGNGNVTGANNIVATGNVTGGNILTVGQVSATGNVTGNYFIGNGSLLTGISGGGQTVGGNLIIYTRTGYFNIVIVSGYLNIVGRTGNVSVPLAP